MVGEVLVDTSDSPGVTVSVSAGWLVLVILRISSSPVHADHNTDWNRTSKFDHGRKKEEGAKRE